MILNSNTILIIVTLFIFFANSASGGSIICDKFSRSQITQDLISTCYDNMYNFAFSDKESPVTRGLRNVYAQPKSSFETQKTASFLSSGFFESKDNMDLARQEFFNEVLFWLETFTKQIPENAKSREESIAAHKITLRLILLAAANVITISSVSNHALVSSRLGKVDSEYQHQVMHNNYPLAALFSRENHLSFVFKGDRGKPAIDSLLSLVDFVKNQDEALIMQESPIRIDKDKDGVIEFGVYTLDKNRCAIELRPLEAISSNEELSLVDSRHKKLPNLKNDKSSNRKLETPHYTLKGYFGGYQNYFNDEVRNECENDVDCNINAHIELHSNIDQHKNDKAKLGRQDAGTGVEEVITFNLKRIRNKNSYEYIASLEPEASDPLPTLSSTWQSLVLAFNKKGFTVPDKLGGVSVRVMSNESLVTQIFQLADKIVDSFQSEPLNIRYKKLLFKVLISDNGVSMRNNLFSLLKTEYDQDFRDAKIAIDDYLRTQNKLFKKLVFKPITKNGMIVDPTKVFNNSFCGSDLKGIIHKDCTTVINNIFHIEHDIIKQLVSKGLKSVSENAETRTKMASQCSDAFRTAPKPPKFIDFMSSNKITILEVLPEFDSAFKCDKINSLIQDTKTIVARLIKTVQDDNSAVYHEGYFKDLLSWAQVAGIEYAKEIYQAEGTNFNEILSKIEAKNLRDFTSPQSILNKALGSGESLKNLRLREFPAKILDCYFGSKLQI